MIRERKSKKLFQIAEPQAGYFTTKQAEDVGVDRRVLSRDIQKGRLI